MAYKKGDVRIGDCQWDAREDDGYDDTYRFHGKKVFQLPHSCDEWIIGGKEEAEQLIADLQDLLKTPNNPN